MNNQLESISDQKYNSTCNSECTSDGDCECTSDCECTECSDNYDIFFRLNHNQLPRVIQYTKNNNKKIVVKSLCSKPDDQEVFCEQYYESTEVDPNDIMQIFIKNGKTYTITCDKYDTIRSIKEKFSRKSYIPVSSIKLKYCGKRLEDDHTLAHYNIHCLATLFI